MGPRQAPLLYVKHMAKHRLGVDRALLRRARHMLLVRSACGGGWASGRKGRQAQQIVACVQWAVSCELSSLLPSLQDCRREPAAVIQSFSEVLEPTLTETCYPALLELYSELRALG